MSHPAVQRAIPLPESSDRHRRRPGRLQRSVATFAVAAVVGASVAAFGLVAGPAAPASAVPASTTFSTPGGPYTFTVPSGITQIHVAAIGGSGYSGTGSRLAGVGGSVAADLSVTPGQTLRVFVAGSAKGAAGGVNGGGNGSLSYGNAGGGGGSSDVRAATGGSSSRLLVAGGGGGTSFWGDGGDAEGATGAPGTSIEPLCAPGPTGATQTAEGPGGTVPRSCDGTPGTAGLGANGGTGGERPSGNNGGGGGGGGYFGGGGGNAYSGGGGGSSWVTPTATGVSLGAAARGAAPSVTISYERLPASAIAVTASDLQLTADGSSSTVVDASVTDVDGNPVPGEAVSFRSSDAAQSFGQVQDQGDGHYTATLTSSTVAGSTTITAELAGTDTVLSDTVSVEQIAGAVHDVRVELSAASILANGIATTTVTAMASDASGNARFGDELAVTSTDAGHRIGEVVDNGDGTYSVQITASTTVGVSTITVTDHSSVPPLVDRARADGQAGADAAAADATDSDAAVFDVDPDGNVFGTVELTQTAVPQPSPSPSAPVGPATSAGPTAGAGPLAATGFDTGLLPFGAAAMLVLGTVVFLSCRRSARA